MLIQQNSNNHETSSYDQDKYQLALDAVIKQMNLLSNDPSNENLRLAHEQARERFIQISNIEKAEYEKFIHLKLITHSPKDRMEQTWLHNIHKLYICYFISIIFFLVLTLVCIIIAIK
jgi:hypothetical protein